MYLVIYNVFLELEF